MLLKVLAASIGAAAALGAPPASPADWRRAAGRDLDAVHDLLRDNSPAMLVARDSAGFRAWLEEGFAAAHSRLPMVKDGRGYAFLLRGYVAGFRDPHIQVWPTGASGLDIRVPAAWPGFAVGLRGGGYEVVYRDGAAAAPPLGARLVSCDGRAADMLAAARDRYDGDLSLESGRFYAAAYLLADRGNPFAPRPEACVFAVQGSTGSWTLAWRLPTQAEAEAAREAALGKQRRELAVRDEGNGVWWLGIPGMGGDPGWPAFFAGVEEGLPALRAARAVVVDLRGNGGGSSAYGDKLARLLWGESFVDAHAPRLGPTVWRASRLNRDYWERMTARLKADPSYPRADLDHLDDILRRFDAALAAGSPSFKTGDGPRSAPATASGNLMRGAVFLLTDHACNSACLDLMDLFTAMPGTAQAGTQTSADTIFMELTVEESLPSGMSGLAFGHKAWVARPRGSNVPYTPRPELTWRGDPADDAGERAWLSGLLPAAGGPP